MPTFHRILTYTEPKYGLIYVSEFRDLFPPPGHKVVILDEADELFETKMHSELSRIDGLKRLHRKHNTKEGDIAIINVDPQKMGYATVTFKGSDIRQATGIFLPDQPEIESSQEGLLITPSLESMLEEFIAGNLDSLEPGLKLFVDADGIEGRQYDTGVGTIDLLCLDRNNNFVVIELKRGKESDKVVGQIARYMGWVKAKLAIPSQNVRWIVILHNPTDNYPKDERLLYSIVQNRMHILSPFVPKIKHCIL